MDKIVIGVIIIIFSGAFLFLVNSVMSYKNDLQASWSNINTVLKLRHKIVLKLISFSRKYFDKDNENIKVLSHVRNIALSDIAVKDVIKSEKQMLKILSKFLLVLENHPLANCDKEFVDIKKEFEIMENKITILRKNYNIKVNIYNELIKKFPQKIIAIIFNLKEEKLFKLL